MNTQVNPQEQLPAVAQIQFPIKKYDEFYRYYLTEHRHIYSRRLHALGSGFGLYFISKAIKQRKAKYLVYSLVSGYSCAWIGHFVFEKNKPATFKQPIYSFISDWRMLSDIARGRLSLKDRSLDKIPS